MALFCRSLNGSVLIVIGHLVPAAVCAQDAGPGQSGWIFDTRALAELAAKNRQLGRLNETTMRREVWRYAWRAGPRGARIWQQKTVGHEHAQLAMIAAVGLSGGASARDWLLAKLSRPRTEPAGVFLCMAAARSGVGFPVDRLLRFARDSSRSEVERLAARLAVLATGARVDPGRFLDPQRDKRLHVVLGALYGALHPERELPVTPPRLPASRPAEGSLDQLELRALLLLAALRPGTYPAAGVQSVLRYARNPRVVAIASLALARGRRNGMADMITEPDNLDVPMFLCGLTAASPGLQSVLLAGPSRARSQEWRSLWWAATVRLLAPPQLASCTASLLEAGEEGVDGLRGLCRRVLFERLVAGVGDSVRQQLLRRGAHPRDRFRIVLGIAESPPGTPVPAGSRAVFGDRGLFAFDLYRAGRLGSDREAAGPLLWRELVADRWVRPAGGPGSFDDARLRELNELVRDLFVGVKETAGTDVFLPGGIREVRDEYFAVAGQMLREFPLFR